MKKIYFPIVIRIIGLVLAFCFSVAVARFSGANALGEYNYFLIMASFISMFISFGTDNLLLKKGNGGIFISTIVIKFIIFTIVLIPIALFYFTFKSFDTNWFAILFTALLMSLISGGAHYLFKLKFNALGNLYIEPLSCFIKLLLFIVLSFWFNEDNLAVLTYLSSLIIVVLMLYLYIFITKLKGIDFAKEVINSLADFGAIIHYTKPFFVTSLGWFFISATDTFMIAKMLDMKSVGIYNVVFRLVMMTSIIITVINSYFSSEFSDLYENGDIKSLENKFYKISLLLSFLAVGQFLVFFFFGRDILKFWGNVFISGYNLLLILMVGQTINFITGMSAQLLNMTNGKNIVQKTTFTFVLLNIPLNYFFIHLFGLNGAALASAISLGGMNLFYFFSSSRMLQQEKI